MEATPELEAFLANPQLDPAAKASVLEEITGDAEPVVRNFVRVVASKGRAGQLRAIVEEFEAIVDREQGRLAVELTTAYELDDDEAAAIVATDRAGVRPRRSRRPARRLRPDRRDDPPGRLAARRRQRARPPEPPPHENS